MQKLLELQAWSSCLLNINKWVESTFYHNQTGEELLYYNHIKYSSE